jgi:hypothetical protein
VFDFLTRTKTLHSPPHEGGGHGGGDLGLSRTFVRAVAERDQAVLGVTPEEVLNSHLLVFAAEKARRDERVVDFDQFKRGAVKGVKVFWAVGGAPGYAVEETTPTQGKVWVWKRYI